MELEAVLEGILFIVGDDGISLKKIKDIMNIDDETLNDVILKLKNSYEALNRGVQIISYGDNLKLTTKKEYKEYYEKLLDSDLDSVLSQASLETLAIIAYNGPVTRLMIDEIRGINSSHIVRKLISKNLIEETGRADTPGKPILYSVTNDFLDYFGLKSIEDLPKIEEVESEDIEKDLFESKYKEIDWLWFTIVLFTKQNVYLKNYRKKLVY